MRNVVPGNITLRFARPPYVPQLQSVVPAASAASSSSQKRTFSTADFAKWRKQSNKYGQWRFRSPRPDSRSVSTVASTASSVLPTLFSYLSWIPQLLLVGSDSLEEMEAHSTAPLVINPSMPITTESDRMQRRLANLGLKEIKVQGDGACQFRAVAAAMWDGDESRHPEIRSSVIDWLRDNEKTAIDRSGTLVSSFLDTAQHASWVDYLSHQRSSSSWGDQLTLYGASNVYNLEIRVVSSVEAAKDENAIITISPLGDRKPDKRITLSLWHETHYNYCVPIPANEMAPSSSLSSSGRISSRL